MCAVFPGIGSFSAAMVYTHLTWAPRESTVQGLSDSGPKTAWDLLAFNTYIWFLLLLQLQGEKQRRKGESKDKRKKFSLLHILKSISTHRTEQWDKKIPLTSIARKSWARP